MLVASIVSWSEEADCRVQAYYEGAFGEQPGLIAERRRARHQRRMLPCELRQPLPELHLLERRLVYVGD